jgi:CTP synthase
MMEEQKTVTDKGGTMIGAWKCDIKRYTCLQNYGKETIFERHRHRYEYNNAYM